MNKEQFLAAVKNRIAGLPQSDVEKSLDYYGEMIDDYIDDGMSEEQAVQSMGTIDEIVSQILTDTPLPKLVKEKIRPARAPRVWQIVLIIIGSPLWLPILLAVFSVFLSVYILIWMMVILLYMTDLSFAAGGILGTVMGVISLIYVNFPQALMFFGLGLICAGLADLLFILSNKAAAGVIKLSKFILLRTKALFVGKEDAK